MIRTATAADTPDLLRLMRAAHDAAEFGQVDGFTGFFCPWSQPHMERVLRRHLGAPDALALVLEIGNDLSGILLAVAFEHPFGPVRLSKDTVWFIEPRSRGLRRANAMLDAYEAWAASLKVDYPGISGMGKDPHVGVLLERRGYQVADTHWVKRAR